MGAFECIMYNQLIQESVLYFMWNCAPVELWDDLELLSIMWSIDMLQFLCVGVA